MATNTFDQIRASVVEQVRHRVWIISDLQQSDLAIARECLTAACQDFKDLQSRSGILGIPCRGMMKRC